MLIIFLGGLLFGLGLAVGTMTQQEIVISFLQLHDYGLLLVMGGGVVITTLAYHLLPRLMNRPLLGGRFQQHEAKTTRRRLLGAAIFGVGWGLSGICPGSALASLGTGNVEVLIALVFLFLGAYVQGRWLTE